MLGNILLTTAPAKAGEDFILATVSHLGGEDEPVNTPLPFAARLDRLTAVQVGGTSCTLELVVQNQDGTGELPITFGDPTLPLSLDLVAGTPRTVAFSARRFLDASGGAGRTRLVARVSDAVGAGRVEITVEGRRVGAYDADAAPELVVSEGFEAFGLTPTGDAAFIELDTTNPITGTTSLRIAKSATADSTKAWEAFNLGQECTQLALAFKLRIDEAPPAFHRIVNLLKANTGTQNIVAINDALDLKIDSAETTGGVFTLGTVHQLLMVFDHAAGTMTAYVDGAEVLSSSGSPGVGLRYVTLGYDREGGTGKPIDVTYDDVKIWNGDPRP